MLLQEILDKVKSLSNYHSIRFFGDGSGFILDTSQNELAQFDCIDEIFPTLDKVKIDVEGEKNLIKAIQECKVSRKRIEEILDQNGKF